MTKFEFYRHPFNNSRCLIRLIDEYHKHKHLVVGFDFDNTVYDCHELGMDYSEVIDLLKECKELGFILCLYTADTSDEKIAWKAKWCEEMGIGPDYINESPLMNGTKKPFFNILLDDRACLESAYSMLKDVVEIAKQENYGKQKV